MRKLFWCSLVVAAAAAGSVYLACRHVERTPFAAMGQGLMMLGGEEASSSGSGEPVPTLPEEPAPVPADVLGGEIPPAPPSSDIVGVADMSLSGHILIQEADAPEPGNAQGVVAVSGQTESVVVLTPAAQTSPAPAVMPYAREGSREADVRMPYADEDEYTQETGAGNVLEPVQEETKGTEEPTPMPDSTEMNAAEPQTCPEAHDYHRQHQSCPYTGRCYPSYPISPAAPEVKEEKKSNNEKPRLYESKKMTEEPTPEQAGLRDLRLDTMEFRPSDAGFQPFVTRPF